MQEEVEQRVFTLIVNCTKLTEQELRKALSKFLAQMKTRHQTKQPHGKMTVKKLAAQNRGLQSVEVTDQNIGSFNRIARKYGIDFAPLQGKRAGSLPDFLQKSGHRCHDSRFQGVHRADREQEIPSLRACQAATV